MHTIKKPRIKKSDMYSSYGQDRVHCSFVIMVNCHSFMVQFFWKFVLSNMQPNNIVTCWNSALISFCLSCDI